ncbi:energy-coupling factor ABC transporter ATP-binding protein [Anaeroselena agilis]|uniref:ABC transporter ATP-binding protein n=1 Tax=Anaeroselena agilis TaxID=3063788 RepID=A0ABU3P223_9FIRM|nr:ABC transporter ATP-binding protein [Selenomonadales bacterium 4137-cl]
MTAMVFENFSYAYDGAEKALDGVSLTVARGSFTAVAGPSGAGKTTLCLAACGVVPHYFGGSMAGGVKVAGLDTAGSSMGELSAHVGTVLEDYESQLVTMTVAEEVAFALENRGVEHGMIARRIGEVLAQVGLAGMEDREVGSLSGGQKQRLAIASVLATRPGILVLDEPASALDPEGAEDLYALLALLNREYGMTVLVVEHDLARVLAYADNIVVLASGRVACEGRPEEVLPLIARREDLAAMVPPLWQLKFGLEDRLDAGFAPWRHAGEAVEELGGFIGARHREGTKSA